MMVGKKRSDFILQFSASFLGHRAGCLAYTRNCCRVSTVLRKKSGTGAGVQRYIFGPGEVLSTT